MMLESENTWREKLDRTIHEKNLEMEDMARIHRTELDYMDRKREEEVKVKNDELCDLARNFDDEARRMNDILNARDRQIESIAEDKAKSKSATL